MIRRNLFNSWSDSSLCAVSRSSTKRYRAIPSTFKEGANSGGPLGSSVRPRLKNMSPKGRINRRPSPAKAKEKPAELGRWAPDPHQQCERETEARAFVLTVDLCTAYPQARGNKLPTNRELYERLGTRLRRRCAEPSQVVALIDFDGLGPTMATMWLRRYSSDATLSDFRSRK
jgi:hypothetical protein